MNGWFWFLPLISACVGWVITRLAIRLLFRPYLPKKIFGFSVQGVIPRRQQQLADGLFTQQLSGLAPIGDIAEHISGAASLQKIMPLIETHIDHFLRHKLGIAMPMIGMFIGDKTIAEMKSVFMKELEEIFPAVMKQYAHNLQEDLVFDKLIEQKIALIPPRRMEFMISGALKRELRVAAFAGALIGFLTGLVQLIAILTLS